MMIKFKALYMNREAEDLQDAGVEMDYRDMDYLEERLMYVNPDHIVSITESNTRGRTILETVNNIVTIAGDVKEIHIIINRG